MTNKFKDLSLGTERIVDDLGRIVIPKGMRDKLKFKKNQKVNIKLFKNHIQIEKSELTCCFCNSEKDIEHYNNFPICSSCLKEIIEKFSK